MDKTLMPRLKEPLHLSQTAQFYLLHNNNKILHYVLFLLECDKCRCDPDLGKFLKKYQTEIVPLMDSSKISHRPYYSNGIRCQWMALSPETATIVSLTHQTHMIINFSGEKMQSQISRFRYIDNAVEDPLYTMTKAFLLFGEKKHGW